MLEQLFHIPIGAALIQIDNLLQAFICQIKLICQIHRTLAALGGGMSPWQLLFFSDFVLSAGLLDLLFFSDISTAAMPTVLAGPASLLPTINF